MNKSTKVLMMFTVVALLIIVAVYFYKRNKQTSNTPPRTQPSATESTPTAPASTGSDSAARYIRVTSY